jgi:hypothetical protein
MFKRGALKNVVLLERVATGERLVGHHFTVSATADLFQVRLRESGLARALSQLAHPNVAPFRGTKGGWFLFALVEGCPLDHYASIPVPWAMWWLRDMLYCLSALAEQDLCIRGFDPSDFVVSGNHLVLTDLGLLEQVEPETAALSRGPARLAFMAPEARHAILPDARQHLYSAAAVCWWMLLGEAPREDPRGLREEMSRRGAACPAELADLLADMMEFNPQRRLTNIDAALDRLFHAPDMSSLAPPSPARPWSLPGSDSMEGWEMPGTHPAELPDQEPPQPSGYVPRAPLAARPVTRPVLAMAAAVLVVVLLAGLHRTPVAPTRPPLLTVTAGRLDEQRPGHMPEWQTVAEVTDAGVTLVAADRQHETILTYLAGTLALEPRSVVRFLTTSPWRVQLLQGAMRVSLGRLPDLDVLCGSASVECGVPFVGDLRAGPSGDRVQWREGTATLQDGSRTVQLGPQPGALARKDGQSWSVVAAP